MIVPLLHPKLVPLFVSIYEAGQGACTGGCFKAEKTNRPSTVNNITFRWRVYG